MINLYNYHEQPEQLSGYEDRIKFIPDLALAEAYRVKHRIPELEPTILKDAECALHYAATIIKDRWPEAEPLILKNPNMTSEYIRVILKDQRWPEAEPIILKSPRLAYEYSAFTIKGRWPEAEKAILKSQDALMAARYAISVIKGPWPEADDLIRSFYWADFEYKKMLRQNQPAYLKTLEDKYA